MMQKIMQHEFQTEGRSLTIQLTIEEQKLETVRDGQQILQENAFKLRKDVENSLPELEEAGLA